MGILDKVAKASEAGEDFLKCLIWGENGSGKSTLCGTAPGPILYLYTEPQGLVAFKRMAPDADTLAIRRLDDLRQVLAELRQGSDYKSVCLDSFTEMQAFIVDEVLENKDSDPKDPDGEPRLYVQDFGKVHDRSKALVRAFRDLPMNVVLTCLAERVVIGTDADAQVVTQLMLTGKKLPPQMGCFFNLVGYIARAGGRDSVSHGVLFEGRPDIVTKGMPGLRRWEEPDISYWHARAIGGAEPRDPDAPQVRPVSRRWASEKAEGGKGRA